MMLDRSQSRVIGRRGDLIDVELVLANHDERGAVCSYRKERVSVPVRQPAGVNFIGADAAGRPITISGHIGSNGSGPPAHAVAADLRKMVRRTPAASPS